MIDINLIGYLAGDPTSRKAGSSTATDFRIGCRSTRKDKNGEYITNFFSCTAFGQPAEFVMANAKKGSKVFVNGAFVDIDYDKKDGTKGHALSVTVNKVDVAYVSQDHAGTQKRTPQATTAPQYDAAVDSDNPF